jgi:sugar/nucleoside kinase (ribokinase family)
MYAAGFLASLSKRLPPPKAGEIGGYLAEEIIQGPGAQFELDQIRQLKLSLFE